MIGCSYRKQTMEPRREARKVMQEQQGVDALLIHGSAKHESLQAERKHASPSGRRHAWTVEEKRNF